MRHRRALPIGLVAILLGLLLLPVTAGAAGTLDQFFLPTPTNINGLFGVSGGGGQMTGQTFTAGITGTLTQVDLYIAFITATTPHGSAPLTVQIQSVTRDGAPSGEVLGSATVLASQVPIDPNPGWVAVPITARSVAGKQYAIVLSTPDPLTDYAVYRTTEPVGFTPYAGGRLWFFTPTVGVWFTEPVLYDSFFRTYVTRPGPPFTPPGPPSPLPSGRPANPPPLTPPNRTSVAQAGAPASLPPSR
jgi:hypothetical protein